MMNNKSDIFIHYGHKNFIDNLWAEIKNVNFVKPHGGLWASRIDAKYGWKEWCNDSQFRKCNIKNSFCFKLKKDARLLTINSIEELKQYPKDKKCLDISPYYSLDFEELKKSYDAIEVNISNDKRLYWDLYGWDCDSILILNKKILQIIEGGQ